MMYLAISIDGNIADKDGGVAWLDKVPNPDKSDYGYKDFFDSIDTTIMGNNTYRQVLSFGIENPYKGKTNYVVTRDKSLEDNQHVSYISENITDFVANLKEQDGFDIWCVGGAELNAMLLNNQLIDELIVFMMPVVLGDGVPMTSNLEDLQHLI